MVENFKINDYDDEKLVQVFVYNDEEKKVLINKVNKFTNLIIAEYRPSGKYNISLDKERNYDNIKVDIEYKKDYFLRLIAEGYDSAIVNKLFTIAKSISSIDEIDIDTPTLEYQVSNWNNNPITSVEINIYKEKKKA